MSKYFRPWNIDQTLLLPPNVQDFVPKGHVSRFIVELVRESLDLREITGSYVSGLGQPPFDPRMMVALLLHGYASGLYSSRRIAKACRERNDFVMIVALDPPDFRTISDFRKRHLKALGALFLQVLRLCETAGLVKLGHFALDGTKIKANASKHKAMSYERMKKREAELKAEVARMLAAAEAADSEEDETFGRDKRGDEMPDWAGDKQKRLAKIQQAMAALEADARLAAAEERRIEAEKEQQRQAEGRKKPGKPAAPPSDQPDPKSQRNFTDPESRIMKSKDGFVQAYNAQAAVDAGAQIIVAHELTQCGNDQGQLVPLIEAIKDNLGRKPDQASADSGYCSESNLEALEAHGVDGYVAPGRAKHPTAANGKIGGPLTQRMRKKIDDGGFETPYRLRKQVVEPVFGQIKQARGFRQFLLRGVDKVRAEWAMICTTHNLLKLFTLANAASAGQPQQMPERLSGQAPRPPSIRNVIAVTMPQLTEVGQSAAFAISSDGIGLSRTVGMSVSRCASVRAPTTSGDGVQGREVAGAAGLVLVRQRPGLPLVVHRRRGRFRGHRIACLYDPLQHVSGNDGSLAIRAGTN